MIIKTREDLETLLNSLEDNDYPLSIYTSTITYLQMEEMFDHYHGDFSIIPTAEMVGIKSKMIFLLNRFVEEVGSSIRNTSMSYAAKKIQRSKQVTQLIKQGESATAANNTADGYIEENLNNFAERESMQELLKMKYKIYTEFIQDLAQQISLRRKEMDAGIGEH